MKIVTLNKIVTCGALNEEETMNFIRNVFKEMSPEAEIYFTKSPCDSDEAYILKISSEERLFLESEYMIKGCYGQIVVEADVLDNYAYGKRYSLKLLEDREGEKC